MLKYFKRYVFVSLRALIRIEGGKIFGSGSRTPIAITFLIKNSKSKKKGEIFYYDIGDYLDRKQKLNKIKQFSNIKTIIENQKFENIVPNKNNDWLVWLNFGYIYYLD